MANLLRVSWAFSVGYDSVGHSHGGLHPNEAIPALPGKVFKKMAKNFYGIFFF